MRSLLAAVLLSVALAPPSHAQERPPRRGSRISPAPCRILSARVSPSVVQIFVTAYTPPDDEDRATTGEPMLEQSSGSGVIVDAGGYIVTNAHVVENATRIEVELPSEPAGVQGQ